MLTVATVSLCRPSPRVRAPWTRTVDSLRPLAHTPSVSQAASSSASLRVALLRRSKVLQLWHLLFSSFAGFVLTIIVIRYLPQAIPALARQAAALDMQLRFGHFLICVTLMTIVALGFACTSILQVAINSAPNFSNAILKQGHWLEVVDFMEQVPPKKLAYIALTHHSGHALLFMMAGCNLLLILGYIVQRTLFSNASVAELKAARETSLQFFVFRLVFLGTILETGTRTILNGTPTEGESTPASLSQLVPGSNPTREVCLWMFWFACVGFIRWFLVMLRERFHSAQASPHATVKTFGKYLTVTIGFTVLNCLVGLGVLALLWRHASWTVISLLLFENVVLVASCIKIMFKYSLYIRTLQQEQPWEERGSSLYYAEMTCEVVVQLLTLAHLLHLWTRYGLSFSLIDLFLFLHVRQLAVGSWRNMKAMRNYARAIHSLNARFPDATPEELRIVDDVCSICRDSMVAAKKLPCSHLFHRSCLQQWIEHQSFCPSCRAPLIPRAPGAAPVGAPMRGPLQAGQPQPQAQPGAQQPPGAAPASGSAAPSHSHSSPGGGLHAVGLRHRHPTSSGGMQQQSGSPNASALGLSPTSGGVLPHGAMLHNLGHSHSHSSHSHSHTPTSSASAASVPGHPPSSGAGQTLFRMDTSRISWLPSFRMEVGTMGDGTTLGQMQQQSAAAAGAAGNNGGLGGDDAKEDVEMPPLEPMGVRFDGTSAPSLTREELRSPPASSSSSTASSSAAAVLTTPPSATATLREKIYQATQKRLEQEQRGEQLQRQASPGVGEFGLEASITSAAPAAAASSSGVSSSSPASSTDPADPTSPSFLPSLPPQTSSPLLLSQADADATLAAQLQAEENEFARQEEQRRRAGGGALSRFFTAL